MPVTDRILTDQTVSVSNLKSDPNGVFRDAENGAIAVLSHNKPKGYFVSPKDYELMINIIDEWRKEHPSKATYAASFNPNAERLSVISELGAEILLSATSQELNSYSE